MTTDGISGPGADAGQAVPDKAVPPTANSALIRQGRRATPDMVAAARPPSGFEPIVSNSPFGWENGPLFERVPEGGGFENGGLERGFRVAEKHINAGGFCHGGMIMTFADIVLASAVMTVADPPFVTVRLTTDFIASAKLDDWVTGRGRVTGQRDGLVMLSGEILVEGTIIAGLSGAFKLLRARAAK